MRRQKSANFPEPGASPKPRGHILLSLHFLPPLSPLSMSSIPPSVFKERSNVVKVEDKGGLSRAGMFVSVTRPFQHGDRLEKYFLACQRRDPLTGGLRHRKSSVILSTAFSPSLLLSLLSEPTFQQHCKPKQSHYFILFNRLLPAPEGRSCIKPQVFSSHHQHCYTECEEEPTISRSEADPRFVYLQDMKVLLICWETCICV